MTPFAHGHSRLRRLSPFITFVTTWLLFGLIAAAPVATAAPAFTGLALARTDQSSAQLNARIMQESEAPQAWLGEGGR
jgi:hypothetical protein